MHVTQKVLLSKLNKAGLKVQMKERVCQWGTQYIWWADSEKNTITWYTDSKNPLEATCVYVKPINGRDDMMTDYFCGSFPSSIAQAIRFMNS